MEIRCERIMTMAYKTAGEAITHPTPRGVFGLRR